MMTGHWDKNKHIFTYFFPHGNYQVIAWSHDKCHLHEMLFPNLKKTVASGILWIKIKRRILTFSTGRQKGITGVLYESRTGMSWVVSTRAHVSKVKFTSGSRPRSSRPRILRSLLLRGRRYQRLSWDLTLRPKQSCLINVNPRTYKESHTPTMVQVGLMETLPRVFDLLHHLETILPSAESLWSSQQDEIYFMGSGAAGGLWRHQIWLPSWPPSWISSRIKNYVKTASIVNFLCLTYKITHKYFASVYPQDLHLLLKEFKTCIFTQKWLDHLLFMTSYLVTIETEHH